MGPKKKTEKHVDKAWIDQECSGCQFSDVRLQKRFRKLVEQISQGVGNSIPLACQDWANTKAAYRFFSNERVSEAEILQGHFESTAQRFKTTDRTILVLHDTSEFVYKRDPESPLGIIGRPSYAKGSRHPDQHTVRGILMHSSLAVTQDGLPLGLTAIKFWTRSQFKGCNALKRKINPTRIPIEEKESYRWLENIRQSVDLLQEPDRCVHIGDRESDIFELFSLASDLKTHFLVRTCVDRLAEDGRRTVQAEMGNSKVRGIHRLDVSDRKGGVVTVELEVKFEKITVLPPAGKSAVYPELSLTVIHAVEEGSPRGREKIVWKLLTNLPVTTLDDAVEKLGWYALRWKIETFHKILKSGCKAEESKLKTSERLVNLVALLCVISWRIFWLTMINRSDPGAPAQCALSPLECDILDQVVLDNSNRTSRPQRNVSTYLRKLARLGGYLARASDPPPGNMVVWRGMSRLNDIQLGFTLGAKLVGN